jgi:hypothetical protein
MLPLVDKAVSVRRRLLGRIHKQAKELWGSDEEIYRAFLYATVQKSSCVDMTNDELRTVEQALYERIVASRSPQRQTDMTTAQIAMIEHLCRELGWDGSTDIRFKNFANRTLKVQLMNFEAMSQKQASFVITGLQKWLEGMKA